MVVAAAASITEEVAEEEEVVVVAEVATTSIPTVVEEEGVVMIGVEVTIGVGGVETEVVRFRVAGQMVEVVVGWVIMATTKMEVDIRGVAGEGAMEEEEEGDTKATKVVPTILEVEVEEVVTTAEVDTRVVEVDTRVAEVAATSTTPTNRMEAGIRREGVGEDVGAGDEAGVARVREEEEAGVAEVVRTTTRVDSLNSSSSTEATSTISRALARATTRAETTAKARHHSTVCASVALEWSREGKKGHQDGQAGRSYGCQAQYCGNILKKSDWELEGSIVM